MELLSGQGQHESQEFGLAGGAGLGKDSLEVEAAGFQRDGEEFGSFANFEAFHKEIGEAGFCGGETIELAHDDGAWPGG